MPQTTVGRACAALLASVAVASPLAAGEVPDPLPYDASLPDPVFAVLVGLINSGAEGRLSGDRLRQEIRRRGKKTRLPADLLVTLDREKIGNEAARVALRLKKPMNQPIPYSILWYRPGAMQASAETLYTEHVVGTLNAIHAAKGQPPRTLEVTETHILLLESGGLAVDIDGWLDKLMGSALDDTDVHTFGLVRFQNRRLGIAVGRNREGRPRQGVFDMTADKVLFPVPAEIRSVVRAVRDRANALRQPR